MSLNFFSIIIYCYIFYSYCDYSFYFLYVITTRFLPIISYLLPTTYNSSPPTTTTMTTTSQLGLSNCIYYIYKSVLMANERQRQRLRREHVIITLVFAGFDLFISSFFVSTSFYYVDSKVVILIVYFFLF